MNSVCQHSLWLLVAMAMLSSRHAGAEPALTLDLATAGTASGTITRVHHVNGDGRAGFPVAGGHDCDGDGFADVGYAGIQSSPLGRMKAGEVTLVFMTGVVGGVTSTTNFQPDVLKIAGDQTTEIAGAEIWIDDVTGDAIGDLLICRQNYTPAVGREGAGALTILVGGAHLRTHAESLQYFDLRTPPPVPMTTFYGDQAYDRLGIWVRTGDVTGDGIADIVVGSDEVDSGTETNRGAVYVIRGGAHLAVTQTVDFSGFGSTALTGHVARIHPPHGATNYHFGATVQTADLDGNGRCEVLAAAALNRAGAGLRLISAPPGSSQSSGGAPLGILYIAWDDNFSTGTWAAGYEFVITNAPGSFSSIRGSLANQSFGEEIIGGLDYDGDGKAELFAGDLVADAMNGVNCGLGHVFYNAASLKGMTFNLITPPTNVAFTEIHGPVAGAIGADTVAHGDFDGDGVADLAVGNPHDEPQGRAHAGSVHILYGQSGGWPEVIDLSVTGLPNREIMRIALIEGALGDDVGDRGDTLCYSAATGDIDADGRPDLIVNEMAGNGIEPDTVDVGNLLVISGGILLDPRPVITGFTPSATSPGTLRIHFDASARQTGLLQSAHGLSPGTWSNVMTGLIGTGDVVTVTNTPEPGGTYYRMALE